MAIPKSFLKNFVKHGSGTPPQPSAPAPTPTPAKSAPAKSRVPRRATPAKKKPHGFFRKALGAVAGEALKGTGHFGRHIVKSIHEDEGGGVPVNNASSGAVAGLGPPPDEPGVKKRKRAPRLSYKMFKRSKDVCK